MVMSLWPRFFAHPVFFRILLNVAKCCPLSENYRHKIGVAMSPMFDRIVRFVQQGHVENFT